jgi:hypothetical protein
MARGGKLIHQSLGFSGFTPTNADRIAALGKTPGDGSANRVACAHKYGYAALFRHLRLPNQFLFDTFR